MVLLAPYTGERAIHDEIRAAGGLRAWTPRTGGDTDDAWQAELWSHLKTWAGEPARTRDMWLSYGDNDYLRDGMPLLADLLPEGHVQVVPGRHAWSTWAPATEAIFRAIEAERAGPPPPTH
jgi:hypothetical protein